MRTVRDEIYFFWRLTEYPPSHYKQIFLRMKLSKHLLSPITHNFLSFVHRNLAIKRAQQQFVKCNKTTCYSVLFIQHNVGLDAGDRTTYGFIFFEQMFKISFSVQYNFDCTISPQAYYSQHTYCRVDCVRFFWFLNFIRFVCSFKFSCITNFSCFSTSVRNGRSLRPE